MGEHYFDRVRAATGSRMWVNNPTVEEIALALDHGAMGCTTNPAYGGNLVRRAPDQVLPIVRECLPLSDDDEVVADHVQRRLVARICEAFLPLYERSGGREGFVSIQGAPEADTDGAVITAEAHAARTIAPNATPKIPATAPGFVAFEELVAAGSQVIVTEVFSLAQLIETCERWLAVTARTGVRPPFFMSPITGILGDHLRKLAARDGLDVPAAAMEQAGVLLSRACYRVVTERGYPVTLLYGGARIQLDFSGLVGGGMAATINWSTAAELIAADLPVAETVTRPLDPSVERVLVEAFPDMRRALDPAGLATEEYEGFGPVQHFRDNFIAGWHAVLGMIADARRAA
jgi:transaldolase